MFKAQTTPRDPITACSTACRSRPTAGGGARRRCSAAATCSSTARRGRSMPSSPAAPRAPPSWRPQGHPDILVIREGGRSEPFNFTVPYPAALCAARADLRGAGADRRRRRGRDGRSTRPRCSRRCRRLRGARRSRRSPSACCGRSSIRRTRTAVGRAARAASARRAVHAVASPQPVAARIPPRLVGRIDASLKPLMSRYCATSRPAARRRLRRARAASSPRRAA